MSETHTPRRSVGTQAVSLAAATGFAQIMVALLYIWAARSTSPAEFGIVVAAIALGTATVGFVDFGTNSLWVRERSNGRLARDELGSRMLGKLIVTSVLGSLWLLATLTFLPGTMLWIAAPTALALMVNQTSQVLLRGIMRSELVAVSILSDRSVAVGTFFTLTVSGVDPLEALWIALTAGSVVAAVMAWVMCPAAARPIVRFRLTNPWRGSQFYGISNVAVSGQALDLPLLGAVAGSISAGVYGAVSRWTQPMGLLAAAFASASAPFIARAGSLSAAWPTIRKGIWMPLLAILVSIGVAVAAPWLVAILLGEQYEGSSDVLRVLALATIPSIVSQPLSVLLQALGFDRYVAVVLICVVVAQLGSIALLGAFYGAIGAALASLATQLVLSLCLAAGVLAVHRRNRKEEGRTRPSGGVGVGR